MNYKSDFMSQERIKPVYLDCNASNPIEPRVMQAILEAYRSVQGNAGSPHLHGQKAKEAVHRARDQIGSVVGAKRHEVYFTSGATESNNLAILGLAQRGQLTRKMHIISSAIEHKAVLEPLDRMRSVGFEVTLIKPQSDGQVSSRAMIDAMRPDTLLVSLMHVNNETGIVQPIDEVAQEAQSKGIWMHVDAAQGFARDIERLRHPGIISMSVSGHKIFGPQGIGALVIRRNKDHDGVLEPILVGGGQELGLRPGTIAVPLVVGFGLAAELALNEHRSREEACKQLGAMIQKWAMHHGATIHGDSQHRLPHVLNLSIPDWDADDLLESIRDHVSISDGAACTSVCATASHVLSAMGVREPELSGAVRLSWCHLTDAHALQAALHDAGKILVRSSS
ncbi:MAG: aminotransferase class V-fold PLP-dependent enzyme [Planctomycetaceae bacterium]|jgi:cysteine desulfurase|nr:aminotransferase class V-fold PLP-dependent enzyme [Planctomycetaceae bacterium]MCE2812151.1 aminotransferase class V-fold PLP-dependent enzyme [Planctomycetaceae bacterium]